MVSNPFANLQVATKAAEMQAEQADLSLANTLDTLRATGASAGGATALATAALRSKQGVAASIEQQEAANARLRAQGEQRAQQMRMAEAQRLQQADVQGRQFMFQTQEQREMQKLNRLAGLSTQAMVNANAASAQQAAQLGALGGSLISFAGAAEENEWFQ
jgi:DNA uptake protein ComE-like DNA-binding protein